MSTWMWLVICLIIALGSILLTWTLAENMAEAERARNLETIRVQKMKTLRSYNSRIEALTKENIKLRDQASKEYNLRMTIANDRKKLKKAYDIKVASAKGLEIAVKQWHDAYVQLEAEYDASEGEHQKQIDDLTRYYQEQLEVGNNG